MISPLRSARHPVVFVAIAAVLALFGLFGTGAAEAVGGPVGAAGTSVTESAVSVESGESFPQDKGSASRSLWRRAVRAVWLLVFPLVIALLVRPLPRRWLRQVDDARPRGRAPAAARPTRAPPTVVLV